MVRVAVNPEYGRRFRHPTYVPVLTSEEYTADRKKPF